MKAIKCKRCKGEGWQGLSVEHPDDRGILHVEIVMKCDCEHCSGTGITIIETVVKRITNLTY